MSAPGGSAPAHPTPPKSLTGQQLRWNRCPDPAPAQGPGPAPGKAWECATLKVPLDWDQPRGRTIGLALVRAKALDRDKRIGSLIFNFGGPGASGANILPAVEDKFERLRHSYDLVGFDPRGAGRSHGITCLSGAELDRFYARDATPDTPEERAANAAQTRRYAAACQKESAAVLPHVDTESAARDIDLMREVLGDRKTSYFGISYGTLLGAMYVHLFPEKAGRIVLDGAVDPTLGPEQADLMQTRGFQLALDQWMKKCVMSKKCPTGQSVAEGNRRLASWLRGLDARALPTNRGRKLTADLATVGIAAALYSEQLWDVLTRGLDQAMRHGRGDILLALSDLHNERDSQGRYSSRQAAQTAVNCADTSDHVSEERITELVPRFREASPVFGQYLAWTMGACNGWPVHGKSVRLDVRAPGAGPVLVIGATGDPATPFAGARRLAQALGKDVGVEIGMRGEGHGAYVSGNACLTRLVDDYLLWNIVPSRGTYCE
ncbi:alpha/beta hydrolase [Streptomyces sp. NPDC001177]